jgi:hypothetical protein
MSSEQRNQTAADKGKREMDYYKVSYASPRKHEHWYESEDGMTVSLSTCILNEPGARCTIAPLDSGQEIKGSRFIRVSRLPRYAERAIEYAKSFR